MSLSRCSRPLWFLLLVSIEASRVEAARVQAGQALEAENDGLSSAVSMSALDNSSGASECPGVVVKRCRNCQLVDGKCGCFKLQQTQKGWGGDLCFPSSAKGRCTGSGAWHWTKTCSLKGPNFKPLVDGITGLAADYDGEDAVSEFWDTIHMRHNLCKELQAPIARVGDEVGNFSSLENLHGHVAKADMEAFGQLRLEPYGERTVGGQLSQTLNCPGAFAETLDEEGNNVILHGRSQRGAYPTPERTSLFEYVIKPIKPTGASGAKAMQTVDKKFRLKEVTSEEMGFWEKQFEDENGKEVRVGTELTEHWKNHPKNSFAKIFAMVNVRAKHEAPFYYQVMRNAFAGIPDIGKPYEETGAVILDLKGSGRKCKGKQKDKSKRPDLCGIKGEEMKEQDFEVYAPEGLAFPAWEPESAFATFLGNLFEDIALMRRLKVHDYSLVMRLSPTVVLTGDDAAKAPNCAGPPSSWEAKWAGAGIEFCALRAHDRKPMRMSAVLLDFLQDSTTWHNAVASAAPSTLSGSKTGSAEYATRQARFFAHMFRPLALEGSAIPAATQEQLYGHGLAALGINPPLEPDWLTIAA